MSAPEAAEVGQTPDEATEIVGPEGPAAAADVAANVARTAVDRFGQIGSAIATAAASQGELAQRGAAVGFIAGGGLTGALRLPLRALFLPPQPRGMRGRPMSRRKLRSAVVSLATANQELAGLVRPRHPLRRAMVLGVTAAGVAVAAASPEQRQAMLQEGEAFLDRTGILDRVIGS